MSRFCFLLFLFMAYTNLYAQTIPALLHIKVTDKQKQPVFGVYVINPVKSILLTTTDMDGECQIHNTQFHAGDSVLFQGIGYITRKVSIQELRKNPVVRLEELEYQLEEATARGIPFEKILRTASNQLKKQKAPRIPACRYYGNAQYEKQTLCYDTVVEYRRESGFYFTSGNVIPNNIYDRTYRSYFVPQYMARSYNLTTDGQDTLTPSFLTSGSVRYDIGTRKIFTLQRAIQLFGPLFSDRKYYEIHPVDTDSTDYVFSFQTRPEAYPQNIRISCKGTFTIDREHLRLKKMDFDYIDYQLLRQILLSNQRKTASPFSTQASLVFAYDSSGRNYIQSCRQKTIWKHDLDENFILIEQPSRDLPGFHQLVEKEVFVCQDYRQIPQELQTPKMLSQIHLAHRYPIGNYSPEIFHQIPYQLDDEKARQELGRFMKLEDQFNVNSDKPYYPENYLLNTDIDAKERATYMKNLSAARKRILDSFGTQTD